jgi:SAM-dependent methyltransferase
MIKMFFKKIFAKHGFKGSADYWERRYAKGGRSGVGSYGVLAHYKAQVVNTFVEQKKIQSVIEFGCGDGNQLSYYELPQYTGVDVSDTAISLCRNKFKNDSAKRFISYQEFEIHKTEIVQADLTLSVDVIYHLVETSVFEKYIRDLFSVAKRYVIIYSTNFDQTKDSPHQVNRHFTSYIEKNIMGFDLIKKIVNPYKGKNTMSDFYIYRKNGSNTVCTSCRVSL